MVCKKCGTKMGAFMRDGAQECCRLSHKLSFALERAKEAKRSLAHAEREILNLQTKLLTWKVK